MNAYRKLTKIVAISALTLTLAALTPAFAQGHNSGGHAASGGGGGHAHFAAGGGGHAHFAGGGGHFAPHYSAGFRGGAFYGPRGGFYGRGGYWHGGYWHGGFYGPRSGFGWFLPVLPAFYATYYWGGIPYYYANDAYYTWSPDYNGYVATDPPAGAGAAADSAGGEPPAASGQTYNYPKNGQSEEQQSSDRYQCHQWAVGQSGYDPTRTNAPTAGGQQSDYHRALTACLEGRGYSVK